jgi:hypothetical protein
MVRTSHLQLSEANFLRDTRDGGVPFSTCSTKALTATQPSNVVLLLILILFPESGFHLIFFIRAAESSSSRFCSSVPSPIMPG